VARKGLFRKPKRRCNGERIKKRKWTPRKLKVPVVDWGCSRDGESGAGGIDRRARATKLYVEIGWKRVFVGRGKKSLYKSVWEKGYPVNFL